jgi:hypothetical protein
LKSQKRLTVWNGGSLCFLFFDTIGNDSKILLFILCSTDDFVLQPYETEISTESSPFAIALAKHLHSIGAKMYGAFWCSHCNEQKQVHTLSPYPNRIQNDFTVVEHYSVARDCSLVDAKLAWRTLL